MLKKLEHSNGIDLQFFAEEPAAEPGTDTAATSTEETAKSETPESTGDDTTSVTDDEGFVDENLLPEDLKKSDAFKGMRNTYTKKMQEVAEFRSTLKDMGLTAQQAALLIKQLNDDPHGLAERIKPSGKKNEPELETVEELEPYEQEIIDKAEKRLIKKYGLDKLQSTAELVESDRQEKAQQFLKEVNTAIESVRKAFPEANVSQKQLFEIAKKNQIDPSDMETALVHAVGSAKYKELVAKRALAEKQKKVDENHKSVSPTVSNGDGVSPEPSNHRPRNFEEATANWKKYKT